MGAAPADVPAFPGPNVGARLGDVIYETLLPGGLKSRAHRDGMLAYDFTSEGKLTGSGPESFAAYARRVRLINAHLACLKASTAQNVHLASATAETVVSVAYDKNDDYEKISGGIIASGGEAGVMIISLARARVESPAGPIDWRFIRMGVVVGQDEIERSYALLRQLLELEDQRREDALLYAELLVRAQAALSVGDNAGALVYAWTVAESLLRTLFLRWVNDVASGKDVDPDRTFLDSNRVKDLEGSKMTAWHVAELGSLVGWLPFDLYRTVRACAKARNRWLHDQDLSALEKAPDAILSAQELFKLAEGVDLRPHRLHLSE